MSDLDNFIGELTGNDSTDNSTVDSSDGEPPKKKRGRKPGSVKKQELPVSIDPAMIQPIVNLTFGFVVKSFGEDWRPNAEETEATALYARRILEKRLPDFVGENLPEYMLGVVLLSYVGRVYLSKTISGSSYADNRKTGEREISSAEIRDFQESADSGI